MPRIGASHEVIQCIGSPLRLVRGNHGDDELRQHVERVLHDVRGFDVSRSHRFEDRQLLQRVVTEGRDEDSPAHRVERVARAADALQRRRHALGTLELHHLVHRPDVDAQLEGTRRDERAQLARLELSLEQVTTFPRERPVVRQRDLAPGESVHPRRHLLGLSPVVDEDERRSRAPDPLQHQWSDGRPDGAVDVREVFDRRHGRYLHLFHQPAIDDRHGAEARLLVRQRRVASAQEPADLVQRTLRRRETDALRWGGRHHAQTFEREGEVGAALRSGDGVNLVDDHRPERAEHRASADAGEQDVQRFRRGDQDVRRLAQHPRPRRRTGVAGAHRHSDLRELLSGSVEPRLQFA